MSALTYTEAMGRVAALRAEARAEAARHQGTMAAIEDRINELATELGLDFTALKLYASQLVRDEEACRD